MGALRNLKGLGPKTERQLQSIGISDPAALRRLGPVTTFLRLQQHSFKPSMNFLYALSGALEGRSWLEVARTDKTRLLMELADYQQGPPV